MAKDKVDKGGAKKNDELALDAFAEHPKLQVVYVNEAAQEWHLVNLEKNLKDKSKAKLVEVKRPAGI